VKTAFTIGYEGKNIEQFLYELKTAKIKHLIDVRQIALSRKKGFSKRQLEANLKAADIAYTHFTELGSPADARQQVRKDKNYTKLFSATKKAYKHTDSKEAYEELKKIAAKQRSALLCFCLDWKHCHRKVLTEQLETEGWTVQHF
jgi:uncharacterized protein (DUF488 family)